MQTVFFVFFSHFLMRQLRLIFGSDNWFPLLRCHRQDQLYSENFIYSKNLIRKRIGVDVSIFFSDAFTAGRDLINSSVMKISLLIT